jgi:hypothetical protein
MTKDAVLEEFMMIECIDIANVLLEDVCADCFKA